MKALVAAAAALALSASAAASPPLGFPTTCTSARPCWDWYTLTANQRTVHVVGAGARLVKPCEFAWLDYERRIDWTRTSHRRGDDIARAHGCDPRFYGAERPSA